MASLYKLAVEISLAGAGAVQSGLSSLATGGLGLLSVGAGAAGAAIVGVGAMAFDTATDINAATNSMQSALGSTDEEAANLNSTMQAIYGNNFGQSFDDIATSLVGVEQAFARVGDLSETELQGVTESALAIRDTFGIDVAESANAAATLVEEFGITTEEAMDFLVTGFQSGMDASGDFLDTIGEYSTQFSEGGATAGNFFSILESGMQGGMLGTDKAADAFKEFQVRILDGSTLTASSLEAIGINSESFLAGLADGSMSTIEAFDIVNGALRETEDQAVLMQAGVGLIGTQFEDLGASAVLAMDSASTSLSDMGGATDSLNVKYNDLSNFGSAMWRQLQLAIAPVGAVMLDLANQAAPHIQAAFTALMPHIQTFATWLGTNLPVAVQFLADTWTNQLQPAIVAGTDYFNTNVLPTLQAVWDFINVHVLPILIDLGEIGFHGIRLAVLAMVDYFNESLMPALEVVWDFVNNDLAPVWAWLLGIFQDVAGAISWISDLLAGMVAPPEWVMQMMGGSAATATAATTATAADNKGQAIASKAMTRMNTRGALAAAGNRGATGGVVLQFYGNVNDAAALKAAVEGGVRKASISRGTSF